MHVNDFAPELMAEIFIQCLEDPVMTASGLRLIDSRDSLTNITQICRRWRSIAFSTASLWDNIVLKRTTGRCEEAVEWISRTGSRPLSIQIDPQEADSPIKEQDVIALIIPHFHRCRFFRADVRDLDWKQVLSYHPTLSNLHTLNITVVNIKMADIFVILWATPNLEHVALAVPDWHTQESYYGPALTLPQLKLLKVALSAIQQIYLIILWRHLSKNLGSMNLAQHGNTDRFQISFGNRSAQLHQCS